jgi:glyoxylase I family protein
VTLRIGGFATLIQVFDMPTSLAFYRDVMGFEVISDAHSDTTLYFGCEDVDAAYAELRVRGVAAKEPIVSDYGMKQVYLKDPDGYEICLQRPVDGAQAV